MQIRPTTGTHPSFRKVYDFVFTNESEEVKKELEHLSLAEKLETEGKDIFIKELKEEVDIRDMAGAEDLTEIDFWWSGKFEIRKKSNNKKLEEIQVEGRHSYDLPYALEEKLKKHKY